MQYGYFDDQAREYVITRPDTPAPWANYLGSPEYGALISNNAGGYSFVKAVRLLMQRIEKQTSGVARQLLLYPALIERGSVRNISDLS